MATTILKIYEIQSTGKGVINTLPPENLLKLFDSKQGLQGFQDTLDIDNSLGGTPTVSILNGSRLIIQPEDITNHLGGYVQTGNSGNLPVVNGTVSYFGKKLSNTYSGLKITNLGLFIEDLFHTKGLEYSGDYETNFTNRSLVTKQYVLGVLPPAPDGSETKVTQGTNVTVTGNGTTATPYIISSLNTVADGSETKINNGITTTKSGLGTTASPYVIEVNNLQRTASSSFTLSNADNGYTIFVDTSGGAVTITRDGSITAANFCVGFVHEGVNDITFVGVTNPVGLKSKGQGYQTFIERKLTTSNYFLLGNTSA